MGIKGLNKLINQYASSSISQQHISEFCGSKVAIDSEILIHKYRSMDSKNSHIFGFINNIFWHLENGIIPIYVFDGCPSAAKQANALSKRFTYREQISRKVEELENKFVEQLDNIDNYPSKDLELNPEINDTLDQLLKIQRKMTFMTVGKNHRNECKYLLKLMGIPFIVANEDAEAFCVTLQKKGIADYVYTEDTDIIPYFIASLEEKIENEHKLESRPIKVLRKGYLNSMVTVIDINEILKKMNLSPRSFIDMCILSGCDFCTTITKIGPMKAYTYMQKYHSIENLKDIGICIPEDFKYQDARDIFFRSHDQYIEKSLDIGKINIEDLKTYLSEERGLNPVPIIDRYNKTYNIFQIRYSCEIPVDTAILC
jgi:flap endonuclease-1